MRTGSIRIVEVQFQTRKALGMDVPRKFWDGPDTKVHRERVCVSSWLHRPAKV